MARGSAVPLVEAYDTLLFDLDGVVYVGDQAVPGAVDAVHRARDAGVRVAFVTNNASRPPQAVADRLTALGVAATGADVVTAAQAAARLLAEKFPAGSPVLVVGGVGLHDALRERGLEPVTSADADPVAVVQGYAPGLDYAMLAEGAVAVRAGAMFVASNMDRTLPSGRGPLPGNGSLVQVISYATGVEPVSAGKPELPLHHEAVRRTGARHPLIVGDRLDTDIASAVRAGTDGLLVLTGVTTPADLVTADPDQRPTYVAADLGGLFAAHPEVTADGHGWSCGGWAAAVDGGVLTLDGDGSREDGLRAACAAAWSQDGPVDPSAALARIGR
ncbi:MAG: HAD-IIA family hydrolase [Streptosporangiales bacterium]|nr:HAD-IIA family hydrolase [Streptosporangiales bacterium]